MKMYSFLVEILVMLSFLVKYSSVNIVLNDITLDNNFDEDDPDTVVLIRLLAWYIKFEKRKALKK